MTATSHQHGRRHMPKQIRISFRGARTPRTDEVDKALTQVRRSGVVPLISVRLKRRSDAERRLSLLGYEVALTLHGWSKGHQMHLVDIVRLINAFKPHTLSLLRMPDWHYDGSYDRLQRLHRRVSAALNEGWRHVDPQTGEVVWIDRQWYRLAVMRAPVPLDLVRGCALDVDGTGMDTWGHLHGDRSTVDADGEPEPDEDDEE